MPWTADALYNYLRRGHAKHHGIAGGPMAEVVRELAQVPDADLRAMADYLASFTARADYTDETAEANPEWELDLSDEEIGHWRGSGELTANIALVWGRALRPGGALATAELGPTTTDQCEVTEDRFTLVSLDEWTGDFLEVRLWDAKGGLIASESLYEEDD